MISAGINLVMTVIGFAVSTMFIVFVCTRLICARIQLRASRRNFPTASRSDLSVLERGLHGLEPVVVASFPTEEFGHHFSSEKDTQCTVCLAEYQEKDVLRILPYCRHAFHVTCIDIWLKQHSTCPVCRISLRDSPDRKRAMQPVYSGAIRSLYPRGTFELDSYHYLYANQNYSETTEDTDTGGSIQEDHPNSEASGACEVAATYAEFDKIACNQELKEKCSESPSNS